MRKILCVDDDAEILEYISEILEGRDFDVRAHSSAEDALSENLEEFDLVFTDIKMPGLNGFQFIQRIRERGLKLPIIAISGIADLDRSQYGELPQELAKPSRFIRKPFTVVEIITVMKVMNYL